MTVEMAAAIAGVLATVFVMASIVFQAGRQSARVDGLEKAQAEIKADIEKWQQEAKDEIKGWRLETRHELAGIRDSISNIREAVVARRQP